MNKQQNTQQPVAWQHKKPTVNDRGEIVGYSTWKDGMGLPDWPSRPLYTTPQVPRDVLMAALQEVHDAMSRHLCAGEAVPDLAAIADRYSSKLQHSCKNCEGIQPATCAFTCDYPKPEPEGGE